MSNMDMIQRRLQIIDELQEELRLLRQEAKSILEDNPVYIEAKEQADLVKAQEKEKKAQVMEDSVYREAQEKMKELRADIRDEKEALSQELIELYKEEGITRIEDSNGDVKRLKFNVKLVDVSR